MQPSVSPLIPLHICWVFLRLLAAHLVSLRTVKFEGRRNKRLLTKKGIRQDKKRQIADSFGVNKLSISPVWDFLMSCYLTLLKLRSPRQNWPVALKVKTFYVGKFIFTVCLILCFWFSLPAFNLQTWKEES